MKDDKAFVCEMLAIGEQLVEILQRHGVVAEGQYVVATVQTVALTLPCEHQTYEVTLEIADPIHAEVLSILGSALAKADPKAKTTEFDLSMKKH